MRKKYRPKSFVLQWHVTERCNWRCKHCYQENYSTAETSIGEMEQILLQFVGLVKNWKLPKESARIQITGGEPFLREDFFSFLEKIRAYSDYFKWGIMSNGSLLTEDSVKKLKSFGIEYFQVSLEGLQETNDEIRGEGSFQKILAAIRLLNKEKINIAVSLSLTKRNYKEIAELSQLLSLFGVSRIGARRIVPFGAGGGEQTAMLLEPHELQEFYRELEKINADLIKNESKLKVTGGCENAIFNNEIRHPSLMNFGGCAVNDGRVLTVMPNGDVYICRRLPIKIGNVLQNAMEDIYYSPIYENFRGKKADAPLECYPCPNLKSCSGGAKCVTYAVTGKTVPDVQCWKLFKSLEESSSYVKNQILLKKLLLFLRIYSAFGK
jgi:radical SAM protein with 4Fe4S-binding SPASM domain